jgi:hypothetical protein
MWNMWEYHEPLFPCPDPTVSSRRGQMIHNLPWGTTPPTMARAWTDLVAEPGMSAFKNMSDQGIGLVGALNHIMYLYEHTPIRGTVDAARMVGDVRTGIEIKTGAWKYAQFWETQLTRHLLHYPRILLFVVTPEAAKGKTPAIVHLSL